VKNKPESPWHRPSEKPKHNEYYLVIIEYVKGHTYYDVRKYFKSRDVWGVTSEEGEVVAWMEKPPLPDFLKEEKG
jgi:hypothetical protein